MEKKSVKWRKKASKIGMEKKVVKNGENYVYDTSPCCAALPSGGYFGVRNPLAEKTVSELQAQDARN